MWERPWKLKRCQGRGTGHLWMALILFDAAVIQDITKNISWLS